MADLVVARMVPVGVVAGLFCLLVRPRESLEVLRDIYGVDHATYRRRLARFDEVLGLGEIMPTLGRKLSLGQRMRADLAAVLLHGPRLVYLDEPTIGLDLAVKARVHQLFRLLRDEGTTVMLTSHDLADIEGFCRRLVIIDAGRIIFDAFGRGPDHA